MDTNSQTQITYKNLVSVTQGRSKLTFWTLELASGSRSIFKHAKIVHRFS